MTDSSQPPFSRLRCQNLESLVIPPSPGGVRHSGIHLFALNASLLGLLAFNTSSKKVELRTINIEWNTVSDVTVIPSPKALEGSSPRIVDAVHDAVGGYLAVAYPRELCVLPLKGATGSLLEALGSSLKDEVNHVDRKKASYRSLPPLVDGSLSTAVYSAAEAIQSQPGMTTQLPAKAQMEFTESNRAEYNVLSLLSNPSLTPSLEAFSELFDAYVEQCPLCSIDGIGTFGRIPFTEHLFDFSCCSRSSSIGGTWATLRRDEVCKETEAFCILCDGCHPTLSC